MPACPSSAALAAHRQLHQLGRETQWSGVVRIYGTDYPCALHVGEVEHRQRADGDGWVAVQTLRAVVSKSRLAQPPASRSTIECRDLVWRVDDVSGQDPSEAGWCIRAVRFPESPQQP